jgi:hypothetical protein
MASLNRLLFPISNALYTAYNLTGNEGLLLDDGGSYYFQLYIPPDGYEPSYNYLSENGATVGYSSVFASTSGYTYGFSVTTPEARPAALEIIETLHSNARAIRGQYAGIICRDYIRVELGDTGYTTRSLILTGRTPQGGTVISDYSNSPVLAPGGYKFDFQELRVRY